METPDILSNSQSPMDSNIMSSGQEPMKLSSDEEFTEMKDQMMANFQKPNVPNVNVPEKIVICLDVCLDNSNSLYRLGDGTTFTSINMFKRVLDFFLHSKHSINKRTEFALMILKDSEALWLHDFTNNVKDIINAIDYINVEEVNSENFDLRNIFNILQENVDIPQYKLGECILPPPYVVRTLILYGRSNCVPIIPQEDEYFESLKKQLYFYIDILLAHEEDCALYKCDDVYDALQDLDNGYSYVYEVSRNATKIHDSIAKLLAHPLQRPLQKFTDYAFGSRY